MLRILLLLCTFAVTVKGEETTFIPHLSTEDPIDQPPKEPPTDNDVENAIKDIEIIGKEVVTAEQEGEQTEDDMQKMYDKLLTPLENLIKLMEKQSNVYKFVEARGIDRVILPNIYIFNTDIRMQMLILTKILFDVAPNTTTVMIPTSLVDKLLDIFEEDDNLALKARTIDILYDWLPENPKIQARVMKQKGLEPFYEQVHKLDAGVIYKLLKLFNKILKEHLNARSEYQEKNKTDVPNLSIYKKIGLIERVGSSRVCNGLLQIFQTMWLYSVENNRQYMLPVYEIMVDIEPYCVTFYRGRVKALELFQNIVKHLKIRGQTTKDYYEGLGLNTTELEGVMQKYVDQLSITVKDEF